MLRALTCAFLFLTTALGLCAQDRAIAVVPSGERRVALLIGNNAYTGIPLKNAVNDAQHMGAALKELGFEVEVLTNADRRGTDKALDRFVGRLGVGSVALFFYAGHGLQVEGENYLLGVDFAASSEDEAKYQGLPASLVLERIQKTRARLSVMVLDACRDNPFRGSRSGSRGLATMNAGKGSFIAFATSPGQTAADGSGDNGLFTASLLETLKQPDLDIDQLFARTREKVYAASKEKQLPWTASSVIGSFVFRDLSSQERRVAAEKAQLEAELAKLQADKSAQQQRLGAAEALKREQALKEQVRLKELEEKRLLEEAERRRRLQADAANLDEAARQQATQREVQRKAEEARLAELKHKLAAERSGLGSSGTMSLEQARAEVASLTAKQAEVELRILAERDQALSQLERDYAELARKATAPAPRDEFETTAQYQARVAEHAQAKAALETRQRQEREALASRYQREASEQGRAYADEAAALRARKYAVPFTVELKKYDPDAGQYRLLLKPQHDAASRGYSAALKLAPDAARGLKARAELLRAEGEGGLDGMTTQVVLVDPTLGRVPVQDFREVLPPPDFRRNRIGMAFVEIPTGTFTMGGSGSHEQPHHRVTVPSFWMAKTEVTQAQWRAVMGNNPSHFEGDDLPVEQVSWEGAQAFIRALNAHETDRRYRLPSEAEWEYACRAGSSGDTYGNLNAIAWYDGNSGNTTHGVAQKQPNAFGLYDMLGNVWEWCEDTWHENYDGAPTDGSVWATGDVSRRVLRGGGWRYAPWRARSEYRDWVGASSWRDLIGFRVVCVPTRTE